MITHTNFLEKTIIVTHAICTWNNHWHHHHAELLLPIAPQTINLPLKLDNGQLSLSQETISLSLL